MRRILSTPRLARRCFGITVGGLMLLAVPVVAAGSEQRSVGEAETTRSEVSRLIDDLDADLRSRRVQAERSLLELGPSILSLLPSPDELPNISVREAVRRIRIQLERQKAKANVQASRVTAEEDLPLSDLLALIETQTGNRIDTSSLTDEQLAQTIAADYHGEEFWKVLDRLADAAGFHFQVDAGVLALSPKGAQDEIAVAYSQAFRVTVESVETRQLVGRPEQRLVRARIAIAAEPRLRPLFLKFAGDALSAHTAGGAALEPFNPAAQYELPLGEGGRRTKFYADFEVPAGAEIAGIDLSGIITVLTAAGEERIAFGSLESAAGASRRRGGVTVTLRDVDIRERVENAESTQPSDGDAGTGSDEARALRLGVTVSYESGGPAFESHRTWILHNRVYLSDAQKQQIVPSGFKLAFQSDGGVAVDYTFAGWKGDLDDCQFVYVAPTLLIDVPVNCEFETLPVSLSPN